MSLEQKGTLALEEMCTVCGSLAAVLTEQGKPLGSKEDVKT